MLSSLMDIASRMVFERERRRLMARRSSLRPGKKVTAEVSDYVANYNPMFSAADRKVWKEDLAAQVRSWVLQMGPQKPDQARSLLSYTARYCLWYFKKYRDLDVDVLWTARVIEHWARVQMAHKSAEWRGAAEDRLKSMGPFINPATTWPRPNDETPRRPRLPGYTLDQERSYFDAASAYTRHPRPRLLFFMAAAFGAGLNGTELLQVTADDVLVDGTELSIQVIALDGEVRVVPVRRMYHDMLLEVLDTSTTHFLAGTPKRNTVTELCSLLKVEGLERIRSIRMRATWFERHVENGTEIPLILSLAGRASAESVIQAALRVGVADPDEALAQARLA